jgi:light-regulated signal transduction histidine kinase (bacteriophytochrome)
VSNEELQTSNEELQSTTEELRVSNEELINTQDELNEIIKKLEISNMELEQFAYVASHDLQEPLRMVGSFAQLLERQYKEKLDDDADDYIGFIVEGSHRMKDLIDDLLAFSRLNTEKKDFHKADLNQVLDNVLSNIKSSIKENDAHITLDTLPVVRCDSSQIGQVFQNLISNSIKFHQTPPKVHISAEENDNEWILGVSDEGIGIDPAHQQKIFDVFKRLHTREEYAGTGIGLSICKRIVERHNGRIWVESEPRKGANFYFTLPKK